MRTTVQDTHSLMAPALSVVGVLLRELAEDGLVGDLRVGMPCRDPAKSFMRSEAVLASAAGRGRGGGWRRRC